MLHRVAALLHAHLTGDERVRREDALALHDLSLPRGAVEFQRSEGGFAASHIRSRKSRAMGRTPATLGI